MNKNRSTTTRTFVIMSPLLVRFVYYLLLSLKLALVVAGSIPTPTPVSPSVSSFPLVHPTAHTRDTIATPYPHVNPFVDPTFGECRGSGAPFIRDATIALETDRGLLTDDESTKAGVSVFSWRDQSGRSNHLRATSIATAPMALHSTSLNGHRAIQFRGSALTREMIAFEDGGNSINGMPIGNAARTITMYVRYITSNGMTACGLEKTSGDSSDTYGSGIGGFSYGGTGLRNFGVGMNARAQVLASSSGFDPTRASVEPFTSNTDQSSNVTIAPDKWTTHTVTVVPDGAGRAIVSQYRNGTLLTQGSLLMDTALPVSSTAGKHWSTNFSGDALDREPDFDGFTRSQRVSNTAPYGIGALVGLSSASSDTPSAATPGFLAIGGSQNFSICMDVAAIVVWDVALTDSQLQQMERYFAIKYATQTSDPDPTLPLASNLVLRLESDVGVMTSNSAALIAWEDASTNGNHLYTAWSGHSNNALWSFPSRAVAGQSILNRGGVGGSNMRHPRLARGFRYGYNSQTTLALFGIGLTGGGVVIRAPTEGANRNPTLVFRSGLNVARMQRSLFGSHATNESIVALVPPSLMTPDKPLSGGLMRGMPSAGQTLNRFPKKRHDRTIIVAMRFIKGETPASNAGVITCAPGIYFTKNAAGHNLQFDNSNNVINQATNGFINGMGIGCLSQRQRPCH